MNFEKTFKSVCSVLAGLIVFMLAAGMYLQFKGFVSDGKGGFVLVKEAQAAREQNTQALVLPKGRILGKASAPVTLYEYSSFGCYHCADFHLSVLPKLKETYIDKGLLKVVFVPFPLDKKSMHAAVVSNCLPENKYYDFVDLLFKKQREWSFSSDYEDVIEQYASLNGISRENLKQCLKNEQKNYNEIMNVRGDAIELLGIKGTPSFLIVKEKDREIIHGLPNYKKLTQMLDERLGLVQKK